MRIRVRDLVGENCVTAEAGTSLHQAMMRALKEDKLELDFEGCRVFASPFLNASVGRLVGDLARERLKELVTIQNIAPNGADLLARVILNSQEYYSRNSEQRAKFDSLVSAVPSER